MPSETANVTTVPQFKPRPGTEVDHDMVKKFNQQMRLNGEEMDERLNNVPARDQRDQEYMGAFSAFQVFEFGYKLGLKE